MSCIEEQWRETSYFTTHSPLFLHQIFSILNLYQAQCTIENK
uniref:Uncharacterized protein n=1 Tax=Rhizophora mucronata TaxID=61149 RepID=A0A2P2R135_RHIMU